MLNEITMERLAFLKYLYGVGIEQSQQPEPLAAASILTFHDSVELFLELSCEYLNAGPENRKKSDFMDYFGHVKSVVGNDLQQREAMRRLNDARVSLKHHGSLPSKLSIAAYRANTTCFFEQNTPTVFGVEFNAISLINLVQNVEARANLEKASNFIQLGNRGEALAEISLAFARIINQYTDREKHLATQWLSLNKYNQSFGKIIIDNVKVNPAESIEQMRDFLFVLERNLEYVQNGVNILGLGLDYRRYIKFKTLAPSVVRIPHAPVGKEYVTISTEAVQEATLDECNFCMQFVIDSAIRIQQFESGL